MRTLIQPPPSTHCDLCGGELRLKLIESANRALDLDREIIVCVKCGREQSCTVSHNHTVRHMPDPKRPSQTIAFSAPRPGRSARSLMTQAV